MWDSVSCMLKTNIAASPAKVIKKFKLLVHALVSTPSVTGTVGTVSAWLTRRTCEDPIAEGPSCHLADSKNSQDCEKPKEKNLVM